VAAKKSIGLTQADPKQTKRINAIAKVSAHLFSTKGYIDTSMDDIASAAKVTKGGIYHYFGSKDEILYVISSTYVDLDRVGLEKSLSDLPDISEKIRFIVFHHIEHYTTHASAAKTLLHESYNLSPKYLREVRARERWYFEIVSGVIADFLGEKSTKELATVLTFTLFGMMNWIYKWYDPKGAMKPKELSELIYELFVEGVRNSILK
jgi:TetR/AcrR family transcriptional regulator, cholesterol catabolism regulator